ncbi:iron chelate uptake ABC transporter family permease subunit [Granulicatella sp. zg-ZJ]|uniref:metal ABC transporter permease n=1 Tax=unclassified Granulicatella TaxID=2630493 RepID=UPI0013C285B8|nr:MULTISPECIES: metal ABC transporter permease [unclassified Granulicatella]MBS4750098.1 metal ABC transporter permease [Carnobacteriaceae bacterium zg-ZUI78]NEW63102.1 iron chelate uptake ABC transporter family permease subunit [Granulicatella sp. zg-ZJ]NEW66603.1 iron chelate uptake ABC transporter family permease subunit [Granulicatella sp. zg-84]QMI86254.1 metal ABC transporter permease [Carnobacteriaceae bacterium zg-84]
MIDTSVLFDYSFITVAVGTIILALASSMVGTISVLTKQSLIGDTIGHASYPGVIFAFILFQQRDPLILTLGAMFSGYVSYYLVHWITRHSEHSLINALALVSSSFFGLGMVLKNFIQGHKAFSKAAQAGLQKYLFGQAAFIQQDDVILISIVSIFCIVIFLLFYEKYKIFLFDPTFAQLNGISPKLLNQLTTFMMISLISVGLKVVGAILMSSFLIAPAVTGILCSKHYKTALWIGLVSATISAFLGTYFSSIISGLSTGPAIIVCMSIIALTTFFITQYIKPNLHKGGSTTC